MSIEVEGVTYTDEDLAHMDPLERAGLEEAALLGDDDEPDELEAETGETSGAPAPAPAAAPKPPAPAPAPKPPAAEEAPDGNDEQSEQARAPAPAPAAPAPAPAAPIIDVEVHVAPVDLIDTKALAETAKAAAAAEAEAHQKVFDGTMEPAEYAKFKQAASEAQRALDRAEIRNETNHDRYTERAAQAFSRISDAAETRLNASGIDMGNAENREAFFDYVRVFSQQMLAKGITDGTDLKNSRMAVERAMAAIAAEKGVALGAAAPAAAPAPKPPTGKPASRAGKAPDLSGIPPTLSGAPVGAEQDIGTDEFAHIDAIVDVDERELAMARLTPAQVARYLKS